VVAVVAIVIVLLVAFTVLPTLTTSNSSGAGGGPADLTYRGAAPIANGTVGGFAGGGWTLLFAAGLVSPTNETFPLNASSLGNISSACTVKVLVNTSNMVLPRFTGNRSSGLSPAWVFGYRNSADTLSIVSVLNGQGIVLATLSGTACAFYAQLLNPIPSNAIDSSEAALAVRPQAASFLTQYPNASAVLSLIGAIPYLGHTAPEWTVTYSTCSLGPASSGTGEAFNATVNALTGSVLSSSTPSTIACGGNLTVAALPLPESHGLHPLAAFGAEARSSELS
jgi:hypothetical protein